MDLRAQQSAGSSRVEVEKELKSELNRALVECWRHPFEIRFVIDSVTGYHQNHVTVYVRLVVVSTQS